MHTPFVASHVITATPPASGSAPFPGSPGREIEPPAPAPHPAPDPLSDPLPPDVSDPLPPTDVPAVGDPLPS